MNRASIAALTTGILLLVGCSGGEPPIVEYTIPKSALPVRPQGELGEDRMLGAIVRHGELAWFFKATGPGAEVDRMEEQFGQWVASLRPNEEGAERALAWQLPEGWHEEPPGPMQLATFHIHDAPGVDVSVATLPVRAGDWDEYILQNVNRWRGQMSLGPIPLSRLPESVRNEPVGQLDVVWVELTGRVAQRGSMASPGQVASPPSPGRSPELAYEVPEGWEPGELSMMRRAAFVVRDGDEEIEITVTVLGPEAGDVLANVNRWRGQAGLEPIGAEQLNELTQPITMDGHTGRYVELENPSARPPQLQAIYGVIVPESGTIGGSVWFIKLFGSRALAARERENFRAFVESLRWGAE